MQKKKKNLYDDHLEMQAAKWNDFGVSRGAGQMFPKATREQDSPWNILLLTEFGKDAKYAHSPIPVWRIISGNIHTLPQTTALPRPGGGGDGNTLCLGRGTVGVAQGQERSLHQLAEKHILADQDELSMLFPVVILKRAVQLLHHTKDGNHQTCRDKIQEQTQTLQSKSQSPS